MQQEGEEETKEAQEVINVKDDKEEEQEEEEFRKAYPFSPHRKKGFGALTWKDKFIILILYCM